MDAGISSNTAPCKSNDLDYTERHIKLLSPEKEENGSQGSLSTRDSCDIEKEKQVKEEEPYKPKEWVLPFLSQFKKFSYFPTVTVLPDSVKAKDNILSMQLLLPNDKSTTLEVFFYEDSIIKFKSINPVNPSKFSVEIFEKPPNLKPYNIPNVITKEEGLEVHLLGAQAKLVVSFDPFNARLLSDNNEKEVFAEMNSNSFLSFGTGISADFTLHSEYIYGIPSRGHHLLLEDTTEGLPYRMFNIDKAGFSTLSKIGLYGSIPIMFSYDKEKSVFSSIYWQNASETYIGIHKSDRTSNTYWMSERGNLECYIWTARSASSYFNILTKILGYCAMPQYFSLGYHQCRNSYKDQQDIEQVNAKLNEYKIPCDTLTLDYAHTDGGRYFCIDLKKYPDPIGLQNVIKEDNRKLVAICNPHLKVAEDYPAYKEAMQRHLYVLDKDKKPYIGLCHPDDSIYLDFLNEEAQEFWASQYSYENFKYSTPILFAWNDMNEPSVFNGEELTMPLNNIHTIKVTAEPDKAFQVEHREVHNMFGYCVSKSTYNGVLKRNKDQNIRPHVLSRSIYAGSQKYTIIWTGDCNSNWNHLKATIPMMLSVGLSGVSFVGGDVGGFFGNPESELLIRWYQLGIFMPYFRGHSFRQSNRREPWLYPKETLETIRETIYERYRMLPYWYTCFEEHCRTGMPVLKPVWLDETAENTKDNMCEEQRFFVGNSILAVPVLEEGQDYLMRPLRDLRGTWYNYYTKEKVMQNQDVFVGMKQTGCFIKGGTVVPLFDLQGTIKSTVEARKSGIVLLVALDDKQSARGTVYFDDGETYNYKKGEFLRASILYEEDVLVWEIEGKVGHDPGNEIVKVIIMGKETETEKGLLRISKEEGTQVKMIRKANIIELEFAVRVTKNWDIALI